MFIVTEYAALNGMSIVVYGDQDFLAFCLPISVEMHQI